jgi:catechol 2,3-dioxygenase-like lactoylglutathione lyase family enzyme
LITGVNHITLAVRDIEESFAFYTETLGFHPLARWLKGAYLLAGDMWVALILDRNLRETTLPEYTHIAFSVSPRDFEPLCSRIIDAGMETWQENQSEGASLYFLDPNGHKLEIHASDLEERLKSAQKEPWGDIVFFDTLSED